MSLAPGTPAPRFTSPAQEGPPFEFASLGGRYVLMVFVPGPSPEHEAALAALAARKSLFRDDNAVAFVVVPDAAQVAQAGEAEGGPRWLADPNGGLRRLYDAADAEGGLVPTWLLIDPALRVIRSGPLAELGSGLDELAARGDADRHAGVEIRAPVLIVPRILEPAFCRQLIAAHEADGGKPSGVMRTVDGKLVGVLDQTKRRRDAEIPPGPLVDGLRSRLAQRLVPEIKKVFQFEATRIERFIVACYDAADGGYFRPHIDNSAPETAHRKFAVTINLNAEEFEGGDLRFPEFGRRTYRAPTGGAVVFSCSLLHEATPVTKGRRYATLPFLYDEAAAKARAALLASAESPAQA